MEKVGIDFDINIDSATTQRLAQVEGELLGINRQLRTAKGLNDQDLYGNLKVQQTALKNEATGLRKELRSQIQDFNKAKFDPTSLIGLRQRYKEVRREIDGLGEDALKTDVGRKLADQAKDLSNQINKQSQLFGDFRSNIGRYEESVISAIEATQGLLGGSLSTVVAGLGAGGVLAAGLDLISDGISDVSQLSDQFLRLRGIIQQLTGATGSDLDGFTTRIQALSKTFGASQEEIAQSANAAAEQLNIGYGEALTFLETGFLSGANANGELLDSVAEYSVFVGEAGISTGSFLRILQSSVDQGIFSDKGIDAVKEAVLSIREMTPATEEALNAIGITSDEISKVINEDGIGGAIQLVTERLSDFEDDSKEVGLVLADIFKGAGEDAGINFIRSLSDINGGLDGLIDTSNEYVAAQQRQLESEQALAEAQNELTKLFSESNTQLKVLGTEVLTVVLKGLIQFFNIVKATPQFIRDNKEELGVLAFAMLALNRNLIVATASQIKKNAVDKIALIATNAQKKAQDLLNLSMKNNPIGFVITAVSLLIAGFIALYKRSETVRAGIAGLGALASEVFTIIKEAVGSFVDGFNDIKEGNIRAGLKKFGQGIVKASPINIAFFEGQRLANAFNDGYQEKLAEDGPTAQEKQLEAGMKKIGDSGSKSAKDAGRKIGEGLNEGVEEAIEGLDKKVAEVTDRIVDTSLAGMRAKVAQLKQEIEKSDSPDNVIKDKLEEILALENQIEATEEKINELRAQIERNPIAPLQQVGTLTASPLQTNLDTNFDGGIASFEKQIESNIAAIERRKDAAINAVLQEGLAREAMESRIRQIELTADQQIIDERLRNAALSEAERLKLTQDRINAELEAERLKAAEEEELRGKIKALALSAARATSSTIFNNDREEIANRLEARKSALEEEYQARIEAAEGDTARQQELKVELEQKKAAEDRKAAKARQKIAIKEGLVQAALAVIEASPDPFRIASAIILNAIQLATIRTQQFADGGFVLANNIARQRGVRPQRLKPGLVPTSSINIPTQSNGDDVLATVRSGELILNQNQQTTLRALAGGDIFKRIGVPGFVEGGIVGNTRIPQIVNPNEILAAGSMKIEISEANIELLADRISEKTAARTASLTAQGVSAAIVQTNLDNIRYNRLQNNLEE